MVEKIHDFRDAHKINWHHFLAALSILIGEIIIHELEIHILAIITTVGVFAKDVIREAIEKCEQSCRK